MMIDEAVYQRVVRPRLPPLRVQTRLYIGIVAFIACLLLIFVGIFSPLIVLRNMDKSYEAEMRYIEYTLASKAVAPYRVVMFEAFAISQALEGYVMSRMQVLPNLSAPPLERIEGQNFTNFDDISVTLRRNMTMIAMTALQPGGVYAFFSPCNATKYGRDTLDPKDNAQNFKPTPFETILGGRAVYVGPFRYTSGVLQGHWGLAIRRPIYNRTSYKSADIHTFWGFALTLVNISGLIERNPFAFISLTTKKRDVDYLLSVHNETSGAITILATSLKQPTATQLAEFVRLGTSVGITPNHPFLITIRGRDYGSNLSPANIIIVVSTVLSGLLAIFAAVIAAVLWCTATHDTAAHAPKMAPFAMLTIGPCRGEELWDLASDQMVEVTERLGHVLARQMVRHHAYQIQQVHPLTTSYVTRSVAAAVKMAFSTIEELQRHPIDGPLRAVLGDEVRLLLSYAVHWCTDAAVRVESLEGTYRYEGPDVVYGGRMWAFAAPSVVTASEAVVQTLPCFGLSGTVTRAYQTVDVMRTTRASHTDGSEAGIRNASSPIGGGGSATLYLLLHAAKPDLVAGAEATAAAAAPGAMAPQLMVDNAPAPSLYCGPIASGNSPSLEAGAAVSSLQDGSARSPEIESSASSAWSCATLTKGSSRAAKASQRRERAAVERSASACNPLSRGDSHTEPQALVQQQALAKHNAASTPEQHSLVLIEADAVTRALLQPLIPRALDVALRVAFDYQSITLDVRYAEARVLVYYFYSSYKILFRPLAAPERHNIFRRLVTAFGVPQQGILEHLAARGAVQWLSQVRKITGLIHRQGSLECSSQTESSSVTPSPCDSLQGAQLLRF